MRGTASRYAGAFLFLFFLLGLPLSGRDSSPQEKASAQVGTAEGLSTFTISEKDRKITVHLPEEIMPGDTISGTVVEENRVGSNEPDGYTVEVKEGEKEKRSLGGEIFTWTVPSFMKGIPALLLKDRSGKEVGKWEIPLRSEIAEINPKTYHLLIVEPIGKEKKDALSPREIEGGKPIEFTGPFDGILQNSSLKVGGKVARKLAESPRGFWAEVPDSASGVVDFELKERNLVVLKGKVSIVPPPTAASQETFSVVKGSSPVIKKLLPSKAGPGSMIFILGENFSREKSLLKVFFGEREAKVMKCNEESIAVEVPKDATDCQVRVKVGEAESAGAPFSSVAEQEAPRRPRVTLTVGKSPIEPGETTWGKFQVLNTTKPLKIWFANRNPDVASIKGGDQQTVTTSGGENNIYMIEITGIDGTRIYEIVYKIVEE